MRDWQGVPQQLTKDWSKMFRKDAYFADYRISGACPNCGSNTLFIYYDTFRGTDGSLWEWCSNCRIYEHASCRIPEWWDSELELDLPTLTAEPEAIEIELRNTKPELFSNQ